MKLAARSARASRSADHVLVTARRLGARPRGRAGGRRGARLPGVRQALPGRVEPRHHPGEGAGRPGRRRRGGPPARPPGGRRGRGRGPRDRVRACSSRSTAARPRRACPARSRCGAAHEFYDFEAKYLDGEEGARLACPADLPRPRRAPGPRPRGRARSRRSAARAWPGSTSSCVPTARCWSTRSTRCPGSRRVSMYPRMWAGDGSGLPGAGRPARAARTSSAHRAAVSPRQHAGSLAGVPVRGSARATGARSTSARRGIAPAVGGRHGHLHGRVAPERSEHDGVRRRVGRPPSRRRPPRCRRRGWQPTAA